MFNNFASKAIIPVALSLTGFVVICSFVLCSFIKEDLLKNAVQQETNLAATVVSATRYTMMTDDRESLNHIINSIGVQKGIEHLRIFNKEGVIMFSSNHEELSHVVDKTTAGCIECHSGSEPAVRLGSMKLARRFVNAKNHNVLAITAPIYNDAQCSTGDCHFHPAKQKVLGTLDIGLSTSSLDSSLHALRWKMVVFCIMVLILSVGGVSALLKRNLLSPIEQLVYYVKKISRGRVHNDFPKGVSEIETLGQIYFEMAMEKQLAETTLKKMKKADTIKKQGENE
ncbi:MAG: HAMP domain-containing protein [Pseudomonadota bacterium]|nr:HAMP domain-containing protein [Pseudomonadota bacterium]